MSSKRSTVAAARICAYRVIRRVFDDGAYADRALHAQSSDLDKRDRQLAMGLSYGTVQRRSTLDYAIESLSERDPEQLDRSVLAALRLGLYELLYMDGAPDRAVVNDAVELSRSAGSSGHGLVNAVLRRGTREGRALLDALTDETPEQAAIMHSQPLWIAERWFNELGAKQARALMAAANQPAETALRTNTLHTDPGTLAAALPQSTHTDPLIEEALILDGPFDAHGSPLWKDGAFHAQSRASMLVSRVLEPLTGERILDLCAAPGGKSTHLAALMGARGEIVAVESNRKRAAALCRNAERLHASNVRVEVSDASLPRARGDLFDRVLVDPPCSGLGTLQSHPDLRWRMSQEASDGLLGLQRAILQAGAEALRPGGVLVYSTCTISANENERLISSFLQCNPDFQVDELSERLRTLAHPSPGARQFVLTLPDRDRTQGFFIARLSRS
jgi:16S rRNA (cytosine967-C5)-methyltransferase